MLPLLLLPEGLLGGQPRSHYLLVDVERQRHLLDGSLAALDLLDVVQLLAVLYVSALALVASSRLFGARKGGEERGISLLVDVGLDVLQSGGD